MASLSAEKLFEDIREELVALHRLLGLAELLTCLPRPRTAAEVVGRLRELLARAWSAEWLKAKNAKPRPQKPKAKGSGAHTSVHKVLQAHRQQHGKTNAPPG